MVAPALAQTASRTASSYATDLSSSACCTPSLTHAGSIDGFLGHGKPPR
ncbi:TPA: hypothetical protein N0F65_011044 [Lagenidium giganteum]|uniref:Uncharacterized protein n=1 Tax=Lagenidium giganteum TaxID=4803 RepID=A0AAV2ZAM7_9STRA|nr:TPA: hypothetical protein N0F65_011044 [Lagenidium giganteum]